jgi:predicted dehydrogenase
MKSVQADAVALRSPLFSRRRVLLAGGGRWGHVYARTLTQELANGSEVLWVSRHNRKALEAFTSGWNGRDLSVRLFDELEQALALHPEAAVVVTSPASHATIARSILEHDVPVLVEKPFTLREEDATDLVRLAERKGLILGVALQMFYASYLTHFHALWHGRAVSRGRVIWIDPIEGVRHGEIKRPDFSTPKLHDVYPHVWSILRVLFPQARLVIESAHAGSTGSAVLSMSADGIPITVMLDRRAKGRARRIELRFVDGSAADLDFTAEPGIPRLDGAVCTSDPDWKTQPSPLRRELAAFLAAVAGPDKLLSFPTLARNVLDSVSGAVTATAQLRKQEAEALALLLTQTDSAQSNATARALLIDNLVPELFDRGFDIANLEALIDAALALVTGNGPAQGPLPDLLMRVKQSAFLDSVTTQYRQRLCLGNLDGRR